MKRTLWLASERGHDRRMRQHKGEVARAYWRELIEAQAKSGQNVAITYAKFRTFEKA